MPLHSATDKVSANPLKLKFQVASSSQNRHPFSLQKINQPENRQADEGIGITAVDALNQCAAKTLAFRAAGAINRIRFALQITGNLLRGKRAHLHRGGVHMAVQAT